MGLAQPHRFEGAQMAVAIAHWNSMTVTMLKFVLETAGYTDVVTFTPQVDAIDLPRQGAIDAIILSVGHDDNSGIDLCSELRANNYQGPVMFVSRRKDVATKVLCFENGADDYITEPFDPAELVARIRAAMWRSERVGDGSASGSIVVGDITLSPSDLTFTTEDGEVVHLTPTETRMLACLMRNHGITVRRETLSERIWGFDDFAGNARIDVCIRRLREKIERNPAFPELIHTIRGVGYTFRGTRNLDVPTGFQSFGGEAAAS